MANLKAKIKLNFVYYLLWIPRGIYLILFGSGSVQYLQVIQLQELSKSLLKRYKIDESRAEHIHVWIEKELTGIPFRFCACGRLETWLWSLSWKEYPRIMKNKLTHVTFESSGYHRIVREFDPTHKIPEYPMLKTPLRCCWMCRKAVPYEELAIKQSEWPEEYVDLCWDCYMGKNEEWRKGRWKCFIGFHRWHPISNNPKCCYRCGFQYDNYHLGHERSSRFKHKPVFSVSRS